MPIRAHGVHIKPIRMMLARAAMLVANRTLTDDHRVLLQLTRNTIDHDEQDGTVDAMLLALLLS